MMMRGRVVVSVWKDGEDVTWYQEFREFAVSSLLDLIFSLGILPSAYSKRNRLTLNIEPTYINIYPRCAEATSQWNPEVYRSHHEELEVMIIFLVSRD